MEDAEIIALYFARSERAITETARKYGDDAMKIAKNILNSTSDAEECVNDAYLGAWNAIPPQEPNPLRAYFFRIVRNPALRRYHADHAAKRNSIYDVALDELEACLPSGETLDDQIAAQKLGSAFNSFLASLDQINRMIFMRRYWYSDTVGDIAKMTGLSENGVSAHLFRTRAKLKKYLRKEGIDL